MIEKQLKVGGYKTVPLIVPEPYERELMHRIAEEGTRIYPRIDYLCFLQNINRFCTCKNI